MMKLLKIKKMISNKLKNVEIMNVLGIKKYSFYYKLKNKSNSKHKNWILKKNNNISINSRTLGKYIKNSTYIIQ